MRHYTRRFRGDQDMTSGGEFSTGLSERRVSHHAIATRRSA
jgi:hypothetical protein